MGDADVPRRDFLSLLGTASACGGVLAAGGSFATVVGRYLYPAGGGEGHWLYVARADSLKVGEARTFKTPAGAGVTIARRAAGDEPEAFVALSDVCPHLGCKVHWEAVNERFFCPCHNGAFAPDGSPTEGPPAAANQSLPRFALKVEGGLLYLQVPDAGAA